MLRIAQHKHQKPLKLVYGLKNLFTGRVMELKP